MKSISDIIWGENDGVDVQPHGAGMFMSCGTRVSCPICRDSRWTVVRLPFRVVVCPRCIRPFNTEFGHIQ